VALQKIGLALKVGPPGVGLLQGGHDLADLTLHSVGIGATLSKVSLPPIYPGRRAFIGARAIRGAVASRARAS